MFFKGTLVRGIQVSGKIAFQKKVTIIVKRFSGPTNSPRIHVVGHTIGQQDNNQGYAVRRAW